VITDKIFLINANFGGFIMLSETHTRETMNVRIFCFGLFLGLASFADAGEIPKPDCSLCGFIKDAQTGRPVTDAIVRVSGGPISDVQTDANGFYCFEKIREDGNYRISIDSNEYIGIYDYQAMPTVNLSKDKQTTKDFKLDKACMIQVQVVDEASQPIEGAELTADLPDGVRNRRVGTDMLRKRTDKNGSVLLGGFPPSKTGYLITATHYTANKSRQKDGIVQRQWDYAPGNLIAILNDTDVVESGRIVLQKGVDVNGYAEYEDDVPAADLKIYAYPDWWSSNYSPEMIPIDANGSFTLRHIVPGIYRLQVNIPEGEGRSMGITILQTKLPLPDDETLTLKIPQKSPQALVSIRGKLTFAGDKIPRYVDIQAYSPNYGHHSTMWQNYRGDACDTNFVIDRLEPGKYRLTFSSNEVEQKILEDVAAPSEGLEVKIVPIDKLFIKGTVLNPHTDKPIQKFKARAKKTKTFSQAANYQQPDKWLEFDDAEGKFNIETVGPGIYQVQIAADGFAWVWSEDVNTYSNNPVVIKLSAGGDIKGKVVDEKGQLIDGAKVLPLSKAGGTTVQPAYRQDPFVSEDGAVETVDGAFELKYLAAGRESIKVIHPDYAYSIVNDIEVKEGQITEGIEVVLNKGATVEGCVFDTQGRPQPNVTLYIQDVYSSSDERRLAEVTTDVNGYYRAGGLPEEPLTVRKQGEWNSMGVVCRMFVPTKGRISRLDFGGRPNVTGRIIIDGTPLASRRITLSTTDEPSSSIFRCYAMTENDGTFTFGGIPSGKWAIYYDDSENRSNRIKVAIFEVAGQNVDLGVIPTGFATVRISIEYKQGTPKWNITKAHLQDENEFWSPSATEITIPTDENEPYIAKNVLPGEHYLVLMRKDYSTLRYPVKVDESNSKINIRIPKCTAGIHGRLTGKYPGWQTVWTKDKTVVGNIQPDENGNYKLDNLPAGQYLLGGNMLIDSAALLEFELTEGEQKTLDIDVPEAPPYRMGSLQVLVLDENGVPLTGAEAWLQGGTGIIEPIARTGGGFYFFTEPQTYTLHTRFTGYKEFKQEVQVEKYDLKTMKRLPKPVLVHLEK
jgi:protocatechuate 3,4-dioxygenase beta subunit